MKYRYDGPTQTLSCINGAFISVAPGEVHDLSNAPSSLWKPVVERKAVEKKKKPVEKAAKKSPAPKVSSVKSATLPSDSKE
jgi:hypothetical protein